MKPKNLYYPETIASRMSTRELQTEIFYMARSLNKYLKSTALYMQPEYIKVLKHREKAIFKTVTVGKKRKRKVTVFKWGTSGMRKDELIKRYGLLVKATKEVRKALSNAKGIDCLYERFREKGYNIEKKDIVKAIIIMRESGLLEYEDSERVLSGILEYIDDIGEQDASPELIIDEVHHYIENQARKQKEISTKDFFEKLRKEQTG